MSLILYSESLIRSFKKEGGGPITPNPPLAEGITIITIID